MSANGIHKKWHSWIVKTFNWIIQTGKQRTGLFGYRTPAGLQPEARFIVTVTESEIVCSTPYGKIQRCSLRELERIVIQTNDKGPFVSDMTWILQDKRQVCKIPMGATGEKVMIDRLSEIPGFDFDEMMNAMECVENREFLCWKQQ
jgi:hypothetical protein